MRKLKERVGREFSRDSKEVSDFGRLKGIVNEERPLLLELESISRLDRMQASRQSRKRLIFWDGSPEGLEKFTRFERHECRSGTFCRRKRAILRRTSVIWRSRSVIGLTVRGTRAEGKRSAGLSPTEHPQWTRDWHRVWCRASVRTPRGHCCNRPGPQSRPIGRLSDRAAVEQR